MPICEIAIKYKVAIKQVNSKYIKYCGPLQGNKFDLVVEFSVGTVASVIGMSQISFFFS